MNRLESENKNQPRIIYILSSSYSGSTILDIILGNGREIVSMGELSKGLRRKYPKCSCGQIPDECEFWRRIKSNYSDEKEWQDLKDHFNYWDHFYRVPRMVTGGKAFRDYEKRMRKLFEEILEASKKEIVVDSSKEMGRAYFLLNRFPGVKLIHIVRDFDGIMRSNYWRLKRRKRFLMQGRSWKIGDNYFLALLAYAFGWVVANGFAEAMKFMFKGRVMTVRYEDLSSNPEMELKKIERFVDTDLSDSIRSIKNRQELTIGHLIAGNQIRNARAIVFNPEATHAKPEIPRRYHYPLRILTYPVRLFYGY